jgi:hypothetical protein
MPQDRHGDMAMIEAWRMTFGDRMVDKKEIERMLLALNEPPTVTCRAERVARVTAALQAVAQGASPIVSRVVATTAFRGERMPCGSILHVCNKITRLIERASMT